jgi:hypothetical protein
MKLEQQVTSLDLSRRLKELGVGQESLWYWIFDNTHTSSLRASDRDESHHTWKVKWRWWDNELFERLPDKDKIAAFTVAELGEMLPDRVRYQKTPNGWWISFGDVGSGNSDPSFSGKVGRSQVVPSGSSRARRATPRRPERGKGDRRHEPA